MPTSEKTPWTKRLQPYVGALIVIMGLTPLLFTIASGFSLTNMQPLIAGLLLVAGGVKLIRMGTASSEGFWLFFLLAVVVTLAFTWWIGF